nr:SpoIIE family protein phosphatase [Geodermatophilaceae bacterium]
TSTLRATLDDVDGLGFDSRDVPYLTLLRAHSLLSVAIADSDGTLGVITAVRAQPRPPFSLTDQAALEEIGDLLGMSLRRHRRSVADPAGLIRAPAPFVPLSLPVTPALDVAWGHHDSADAGATPIAIAPFFDYYDTPGGWGIVLGSAEGYNPDHQAYVAMIRQWARLVGSNGQLCSDVLAQLDAALRRLHRGQPEVSAVVVDLRPKQDTVRVRLCSAGHRTSLVLRADGRVQRTDGGGKPLNDGPGPQLHEDAELLAPGDTLLLYSNEFAEITNVQGDTLLGSGELAAALARGAGRSARAVLDGVHAAATAFTAGGSGGNSVVVAVRCTGRPR